ncbi:EAL domain-containing protein [Ectobacillus sp. JY-23]|uniref:EAL domain-containing protein n=1 Tax=Ectobacillus sp. JY-23 TaxID=2933872 RepID=UPI001FF18D72|nr:EAL domain-containing protein [Ectobacillus sp. JY-23]UOY92449.1 EAL domain-containing protein [Ectobacillus sp. JY-23]
MRQVCDVCQITKRGYRVHITDEVIAQKLAMYFSSFAATDFIHIDTQTMWMEEHIFFDVMDYLGIHGGADAVFAQGQEEAYKPIREFVAEREAAWIDDIIQERRIRTHYQPIVSRQGEVIGHELLSRGVGENDRLIPPFTLFEAARVRNRLFALDRACRLACIQNASGVTDKLLFINFIPTSIYVPEHCLATTIQLIEELNMDPAQIVFEVVETDKVKDIAHLKRILRYYRDHGFKYALDDVGTGYNNIELLEDLRPDIVKLAIEFTNGVSTDLDKQDMAKRVLEAAHGMHALALAEGVEAEEDLAYLQALGYDLFQGYYFAKPQEHPVEEIA